MLLAGCKDRRTVRRLGCSAALAAVCLSWCCSALLRAALPEEPLRIVVMDPLCKRLACDCVAGYADRDYEPLSRFLEERLSRPVEVVYAESLLAPQVRKGVVHIVIGKYSAVRADSARLKLRLLSVAALSDEHGRIDHHGLFVVRQSDPARSIGDLAGRPVVLGLPESGEKHHAALSALEAFGIAPGEKLSSVESCSAAALAVVENEADAAVISGYAMPLLEGCGTVDRGALRVIGQGDAVPFITAFVAADLPAGFRRKLAAALLAAGGNPHVRRSLKSQAGFVSLPELWPQGNSSGPSWPDWRGHRRSAQSSAVPRQVRACRLLWSRTLTGPGLAGIAVAAGRVIVADKDLQMQQDIFRCLDADTGRQLWQLSYPAAGEMDFTNAARANPVICGRLVYLLGAFGHLHCVRLDSGQVVWKRHLADDFGAKVPTWGFCSTPLVVGDRLIVNPGAEHAALVALDRHTGRVLWTTPGNPPGYGSFIYANLGGREQIVGHDAISLGGWDPATGKRLWTLLPPIEGDYNVPTPVVVDHKLLVATENNGTRLYRFDSRGRIVPEPVAASEDLLPDTSTPVVWGSRVFGSSGGVVCLDLAEGLTTRWESRHESLGGYCSLVAGNGRLLVTTQDGHLFLLDAAADRCRVLWSADLFAELAPEDRETWSHPALVGNRLYVRNLLGIYCFVLDADQDGPSTTTASSSD